MMVFGSDSRTVVPMTSKRTALILFDLKFKPHRWSAYLSEVINEIISFRSALLSESFSDLNSHIIGGDFPDEGNEVLPHMFERRY
jgi:hypothetical protein